LTVNLALLIFQHKLMIYDLTLCSLIESFTVNYNFSPKNKHKSRVYIM
jgi:hypothetical protein